MPRKFELLESIRQKSSMSRQIVSTKDKEYAFYAGASFQIASKLATIDTMLKNGLLPKKIIAFVKLYRSFLDQQRKAFFSSIGCTEISKLGFLLGLEDDTISAT